MPGRVLNPMQCRGQVEGGVAQALGAALSEDLRLGPNGAVEAASFRKLFAPRFPDVPRTEFCSRTPMTGSGRSREIHEREPVQSRGARPRHAVRDATACASPPSPSRPTPCSRR